VAANAALLEGKSSPKVSMVVAAILRITPSLLYRSILLLSFAAAGRWEARDEEDKDVAPPLIDEDEKTTNAFVLDAVDRRKVTMKT
jgi:hypothetical protein